MVDWSGIESPHARDWFGLYRVGAPDSAHLAWRYVSCSTTPTTPQASGSCALPLPATLAPGTYEIRMFGHNSYELLMTSDPFEVVIAGPTLAATPGAVSVGGTVAVAWSGVSPADPRDWISLTTPGAANSTYSDWVYTSTCAKSPAATPRTAGSCNFTVGAPGTIEFRLFGHNSYERIATSNPVSVTPP